MRLLLRSLTCNVVAIVVPYVCTRLQFGFYANNGYGLILGAETPTYSLRSTQMYIPPTTRGEPDTPFVHTDWALLTFRVEYVTWPQLINLHSRG